MNAGCYKPITVETLEVAGLQWAFEAMRLPIEGKSIRTDDQLARLLLNRGEEHAKFSRGIMVWFKITMQIGFMVEFDTYRIGIDCLSSSSTMHNELKGLSGKTLAEQKQQLANRKVYTRIFVANYQTLRRIYKQRHGHRHPDWGIFCDWLTTLPNSHYITQ
jgi:hypothetical protein